MKNKFDNLWSQYEFELNDVRALITIINVLCVFVFGLSVSWLGLAVAVVGLIDDVINKQKVNSCLIHFSGILMNLYFISMMAH